MVLYTLYCEHIFKLFIILNFLMFLPLDGPQTPFFQPLGAAEPTLRTYKIDGKRQWSVIICVKIGCAQEGITNKIYIKNNLDLSNY